MNFLLIFAFNQMRKNDFWFLNFSNIHKNAPKKFWSVRPQFQTMPKSLRKRYQLKSITRKEQKHYVYKLPYLINFQPFSAPNHFFAALHVFRFFKILFGVQLNWSQLDKYYVKCFFEKAVDWVIRRLTCRFANFCFR